MSLYEENRNPHNVEMFKGLMLSIRKFIDLAECIEKNSEDYGTILYYIAQINYKFGNNDKAYHLGNKAKDLLNVNLRASECFRKLTREELRKRSSPWVVTEIPKDDIPSQLTLMLDSLSTTFSDDVNFDRLYEIDEEKVFSQKNAFQEVYPLSYIQSQDLRDLTAYYSELFNNQG